MIGPVATRRLIRIVALGLAVLASPRTKPDRSATAGLYGRANDFLDFIDLKRGDGE